MFGIDKYYRKHRIVRMFEKDLVIIEKPFEFIFRASLPGIELTGYGFSEKQAIELLEKNYDKYLDSFLINREHTPVAR